MKTSFVRVTSAAFALLLVLGLGLGSEARAASACSALFETRVDRFAALNAYDEAAWFALVEDSGKQAQGYETMNELSPALGKMPKGLRDRLLAHVAKLYPAAGKENLRTDGQEPVWRPHGPKRALDAIITSALRPADIIKASLKEGATPAEALARYMRLVRTKALKGTEFGNYDVDLVLSIARVIQQELVILQNRTGKQYTLAMVGSLPNGRAHLKTSDIDLGISELPPAEEYGRFLAAINSRVRLLNEKRYGEIGLDAGSFNGFKHFKDGAVPPYAHISPVQIRITADKAELLAFPPFAVETSQIFDKVVEYKPEIVEPLVLPEVVSSQKFTARERSFLVGLFPQGSKWMDEANVTAKNLGHGLLNRAVQLEHADGGRVVLRYSLAKTTAQARKREAAVTLAAGETGVGPKVVAVDTRTGAIVQEQVRGRHPHWTELHKPEIFSAVVEAVRKAHAYKEPLPEFDFSELAAGIRNPKVPQHLQELGSRVIVALRQFTDRSLVHGDLHPGNLMIGEKGDVRLIDWGNGMSADPYYDLGNLSSHMGMKTEQVRELLAKYLGRNATGSEVAHVQAWRLVSDLRGAVWGLEKSEATTTDLFLKRADALVKDPQFARWLSILEQK